MGAVARKMVEPIVIGPTDDQICDDACEIVSNNGSLAKAAKKYNMTKRQLWIMINSEPHRAQAYARAREVRAQGHEFRIQGAAKQLKDISFNNLDDEIKIKAITAEVKTRQWLAKVSDPHMFGDRQILEGGDKPIGIEHSTSPNEHARRIAFALLAAAVQPGVK